MVTIEFANISQELSALRNKTEAYELYHTLNMDSLKIYNVPQYTSHTKEYCTGNTKATGKPGQLMVCCEYSKDVQKNPGSINGGDFLV